MRNRLFLKSYHCTRNPGSVKHKETRKRSWVGLSRRKGRNTNRWRGKLKRLIRVATLCLFAAIMMLYGCGGPEATKMKFYNKGKGLYEKGEFMNANLEFKNAIQIDPQFADAYYWTGMSLMKLGDLNNAFGRFLKAVENDPGHLKAQVEMGKLFLFSRAHDRAMEKAELVLKADPRNEGARALRAALFLNKGKVEIALIHLDELIGEGKTDPDIYLIKAGAYTRMHDPVGAEDALRSGIMHNPGSAALHMALADHLLRKKKTDDAIVVVQKLIGIDPKETRHKLALANLYWGSGKEQKAHDVLNAIVLADEKNEERWLENAGFYVSKKRPADAEQVLKEGLRKNPKSVKIRLALSDLYADTKRTDNAIALLKECRMIKNNPKNPENIHANISLAKIHLGRHELTEAKKLVDDVIEASPKNLDAHYLKGNIDLLEVDGMNAVAKFRTVINERPQFIPAYMKLAEAHIMTGEPNLALDTLQNAYKIEPNSKDVARAIGRIHTMQGKYDKAEEQMKNFSANHPDDIDIKIELGDLFVARSDFKGAEKVYDDVKQQAPLNPLGYVKMGTLYAMQGNPGKAIMEFEQAYKLDPGSQQLSSILVRSYVENRRHSSASTLCEEKIKKNPKDPFSYNLLGEALSAQKNYKQAEDLFQKAISLEPTWLAPHNNLARLYVLQGQKTDAIRKYWELINKQPDNVAAYFSLAQIYSTGKEYSKAIKVYSKLLEKRPNLWIAANDLAFLMSEQPTSSNELEKAMKIAVKAQKIRPGDSAVMDTLGWIHYKQGNVTKALEYLTKAQQKTPGNPVIAYHLGMVYHRLGKKAESKEQLSKAVESKDDFFGKEEAKNIVSMLTRHTPTGR